MKYYVIEPEVAGGFGENTLLDTTKHPPLVHRLHYEFQGWLGDSLLTSFGSFIITEQAASALTQAHVTGIKFDDVQVTRAPEFDELQPNVDLPKFRWMKVTGKKCVDDFGMNERHRLVASEKALEILKQQGLSHADISGL